MNGPVKGFWKIRLESVKRALEENNFQVYLSDSVAEARRTVLEDILPGTEARSVSWGGSATFIETGLYEALKGREGLLVIDTYDRTISPGENLERRRQALHADLFFTGTNAVTEGGTLVNLDMIGNRVAALTFGPKHVVVLAGRNKVVCDLEDAMVRVKNYAAPVNALRLGKKTPCSATSFCDDCKSADRICNTWTITEKSFPKHRVKVILINEDLGF